MLELKQREAIVREACKIARECANDCPNDVWRDVFNAVFHSLLSLELSQLPAIVLDDQIFQSGTVK